MNKKEIIIVALLILSTAVLRVFTAEAHWYNFVPVAALGLFSGSVIAQKKWAYLIPLMPMLLSDIGLSLFTSTQGFYGISQFVNYLALGLVTLLGTKLVKRSALNITGFTIGGSLLFFILSNFGTFLSGYYGYSFSSLIECYTMAIPFYKSEFSTSLFVNSFRNDLLFSFIAFGIYQLATVEKFQLKKA